MNRRFQRWVKRPTPKRDAFWVEWMAGQPERKQLVEEARRLVRAVHFADDLTEAEIAEEWTALQHLAGTTEQPEAATALRRSLRLGVSAAWRAAAVFTGLLVSVALLYAFLKETPSTEQTTGSGEIKTVHLPDGSLAVLNANSRLVYPAAWEGDKPREVWLEGEAYFSVTHRANNQRFIVRSADAFNIEVLGTTFTVLNRQDRNRVVLNSGKVRLQTGPAGAREPIVMKPGELVEVAGRAGKAQRRYVNPATYLAFKDHKLVFDNTTLAEVGRQVRDTYGWQVTFTEAPLLTKEFTGTFPLENPDLLLQALRRTYHLDMRREGNQLRLHSKTTTP